jgi:DNA modification methylase
MCFKGEPQIIKRNQPNVIHATPVSTSEREAVVERPTELYRPFIERLTVPGERVADFFVGAGGVPAAAASMGRDFFGIERNPARRAIAINKVLAHMPK